MDRRSVRRALAAGAAITLLGLALASCSNPIDIVAAVTNEVKLANNKYLVVKETGPFAQNDAAVSPGSTVWIAFDRDVNTNTVSATSIVFTPDVSWNWSYNPATKTLTILPLSLESLTAYTMTVGAGLKGTDGSTLQTSYVVSFTTKRAPAGSITIAGGADYATSHLVTLSVSYNSDVTDMRWSLNKADIVDDPNANALNWQTKATSIPNFDLGADGPKTVYIQFRDLDNNVTDGTSPINDSIILDSAPPVFSSFSINNGDVSAPTTSVTLTSSVADATTGVEMRVQNYTDGTTWGAWQDYTASLPWTLVGIGTRAVNVQFRDKAGNTDGVTYTDAIIAGAPTLTAFRNNHSLAPSGSVYLAWDGQAADVGTNTYQPHWSSSGQIPEYNYGSPVAGTSVTLACTSNIIYDFSVSIINSVVGTSVYSSPHMPGYTTDVVIVYNDSDSTDTALATTLQTILTNSNGWRTTYASYITGTQPTWSVMRIPQSQVATTYSLANRVYGYPVIVTPGATLYSSASQVRNVTSHGKGVVCMGYGGASLIDRVNTYFSRWGYTGTQPSLIGLSPSYTLPASAFEFTWTTGNSVWTSPLTSTIIPTTTNTTCQVAYGSPTRYGIYRSNDSNPMDGWLYGKDNYGGSTSHYFSVVRQGRFLQYGFQSLTDRPYTGYPYIVNLVYRMSEAYYP